MLDQDLKSQLASYLTRLRHPITLTASLDNSAAAEQMRRLLRDIASLSPLITLDEEGRAERRPSFQVSASGQDMGLHFAAVPLGHEFSSLVLALLQAGGHPPKVEAEVIQRIISLPIQGRLRLETFMSLSCHNCPDVVQALNLLAVLHPQIDHVAIDGALFQDEVTRRGVMAVPLVMVNGQVLGSGRMSLDDILAKLLPLLDSARAQEQAALQARAWTEQAPFEMLIVGSGPAGAAAALYAARKGIRVGVVGERFGGQTLDTLGIENFVSIPHTEGPQLAAALKDHVRRHEVALMDGARAVHLEPARSPGGWSTLTLDNGATLRSRSVVLATGARWRTLDVPGEERYRNRGVAYCPHCDGPLFRGKDVAVVGGGNSGVEAAIDLAGLARHVTVIEYGDALKADAVLVERVRSLPNVEIHTHAQTLEVLGDGRQVTGLRFRDRGTGQVNDLALSGVFVQIGLKPNTEWLEDTVTLSRHREIVVDARGNTSATGIFAAGDVTTTPYKQIIIAAGDGAKVALAAFDYLMRTPQAASPAAEAVPA